MESSKTTACHIKQVADDPQAAQINLLRHQCTELPAGKYKKKNSSAKSTPSNYKQHGSESSQVQSQHKKRFDAKSTHQYKDRCSKCGDSAHVEGFQCPAKNIQCKACHKFGHFTSLWYQKKQASFKSRKPKVHQLQAGTIYAKDSAICSHSEDDSSSEDSCCLQVKMKHTTANHQRILRPTHLITNLAFRLKPHHSRNLYLTARLDTHADVNIMPTSVCRSVFEDPNMKKLALSSLEIGTYTTDIVKIVGSCMFYLVHPDAKELMDVTFFVAVNDACVLLSCKTTLMLGLMRPRTRLDYLPPRPSLITSSGDHPKKPKSTLCVQKLEVSTQRSTISVHLKEMFKEEVDKMLQAGVLKPVHEATPWINSLVPVEVSKNQVT